MFGGAAQAPDLPLATVSGCGSSALTTTLAEAERDTRSEQRPAVLLRPRRSPPAADPNHGSPAPGSGGASGPASAAVRQTGTKLPVKGAPVHGERRCCHSGCAWM